MNKYAYYLLDDAGVVINEVEGKSFYHKELPLCPDIAQYIWQGDEWIINQELQTKERIKEINFLLDKNKQNLIKNKVIYTEDDPNFIIYE